MNQRAARDALAASQVSIPARAVYLALLTFANSRGDCWPHQLTLAAVVGMPLRSLQRRTRELRDAGLIETARRGHGNAYHLPVENVGTAATVVAGVKDADWRESPATAMAADTGHLGGGCIEAPGTTSELAPHFSPGTGWMREKRASGGRR